MSKSGEIASVASLLVEAHEPNIAWRHLWTGEHEARGTKYDLHVCRIVDGGQLCIYVFKNGEFLCYIFDHRHDATCSHGSKIEVQNVDDLVSQAIEDINQNVNGMY